ncbi:type II toxin-antitoxin system YafQ family toxin, partial [Sulfuricurvum sp.]|uniref:type II toxin-antitoxin system YafQ family toxin n=1 Tax=Sulfuricurvum sp. TaxID=2025608 RepID=UPI003BB51388
KAFLKDYATIRLTDTQFEKLISYLNHLREDTQLPPESKDHALKGDWKGFRECHLGGDMLLAYTIEGDTVILARLGSHSQIFG